YNDIDTKTGKPIPWEKNRTMEHYYEKLIQRFEDPDKDDESEGEGEGDGQGDGKGKGKGKGKGGKGNAGVGADTGDLPQTLDEHMWDGAAEEGDMLDATEELVKRARSEERRVGKE